MYRFHILLLLGLIPAVPSLAEPLKVLFFTHAFPELIQPFVLNQMIGFIDHGHEITILTPTDKSYGENFTSLSTIPTELHPAIAKYDLLHKTYYKELPKDKRNFDVILCQQGTFGVRFLRYRKKHKIKGKILTFFRGKDTTAALTKNPHLYDKLFKKGALFLPVCEYFKSILLNHGCSPEKIVVLHAAIDCKKFKFRARKPSRDGSIRIVTTGRLVEKKGTEYAIRAIHALMPRYPTIELTIIGGGPLEGTLQTLIEDLGVQNHVKLVGWKTQEEVIEILKKSHIFVLPAVTAQDNDQEGISNALKEAMAMGIPVIATYHSGLPELIENEKTGFLVQERDVTGLVDKTEYLINHPERWYDIARVAREKVAREFNMKNENKKLIRLCEEMK